MGTRALDPRVWTRGSTDANVAPESVPTPCTRAGPRIANEPTRTGGCERRSDQPVSAQGTAAYNGMSGRDGLERGFQIGEGFDAVHLRGLDQVSKLTVRRTERALELAERAASDTNRRDPGHQARGSSAARMGSGPPSSNSANALKFFRLLKQGS